MPATGADQLRTLALRCKELGDRSILNATRAEIRTAAAPLITAMQDQARATLPRGGGLNELEAGRKWRVSVTTGARTAGVKLTVKGLGAGQTNQGFVRHPVFGRKEWVQQQVPAAAGWATDTADQHGPVVAAQVAVAIDRAVAVAMDGI